jgi:hypothetical protein
MKFKVGDRVTVKEGMSNSSRKYAGQTSTIVQIGYFEKSNKYWAVLEREHHEFSRVAIDVWFDELELEKDLHGV